MKRGTALVTGSSSGFGLETCVALAARGFRVYASMRELERGLDLRRALDDSGFGRERVELVTLDVTDADARAALVESILEREGAVDVLVNNAGQLVAGFVEELDEAALREQFETNFFGLTALTQALLPAMRERRHGRIINLSSAAGRSGLPAHAAYCASKFALEGWSESLRYELVPYNVFVSVVEPGLFPTQIHGRNRIEGRRGGDRGAELDPGYARVRAGLDAETRRLQRLMSFADPADVAARVADIALCERPRLRYPVGVDAWVAALSSGLLTQAWWEAKVVQLFQR